MDLPLAQYRALAEFRCQLRRFLHFSEEQARSRGLEPQQHQLLLAIKGLPEDARPTIRELAGRLQLKHHSTVELVDRLERRKYVTRSVSAGDRREVAVRLTKLGARALRKLSLVHREELRTAGPALSSALRSLRKAAREKAVRAARHAA